MSVVIPLCSSSGGNSVFAGSRSAGVLIDAGCSFKQLRLLLSACEIDLSAVKAVLITHEHIDHVKGLFQLTKHTDIPVYVSDGTREYLIRKKQVFSTDKLYSLAELKYAPVDYQISAFRTPHDAAESVGYILENEDIKIGYCTDLGIVTDEVRKNMTGCDFVFLESNYQPELLQRNRVYPPQLKRRVASGVGHLSNLDCAEFLTELLQNGAKRFILGHLSRENNKPEIAFENARNRLTQCGAEVNRDYTLDIAPVVTEGRVIAV